MATLGLANIARPYANAAFQVAQEGQQLAGWARFLEALALISQNEQAGRILTDPRITPDKKSEWLASLCSSLNVLDDQRKAFLHFIARHRRLTILPMLSLLFQQYKRDHEKCVLINVRSAEALSVDQQSKLTSVLKNRYQREVTLSMDVDRTLVGGLIINAGDEIIDGSLRGQLHRLQSKLANPYQ